MITLISIPTQVLDILDHVVDDIIARCIFQMFVNFVALYVVLRVNSYGHILLFNCFFIGLGTGSRYYMDTSDLYSIHCTTNDSLSSHKVNKSTAYSQKTT